MKRILLVISVILVLAFFCVLGYAVHRNQLAKEEADRYDELVSDIVEEHGEDGIIAMAIIEKIDILEELGRSEEVIKEVKRLIGMDLDSRINSDAIWRIVDHYEAVGDTDTLVSELREVYRNTKDSKTRFEVLLAIVSVYKDIGEHEKALEILNQTESSNI